MIRLNNIDIRFKEQIVFNHADIEIPAGKLAAICGKSGSGKTTLFYILGLISSFKGYTYEFQGNNIDLNDDELKAKLRKSSIGFVFQDKNLHEYLSIAENIKLYSLLAGKECDDLKVSSLLEKVNLSLDPSTKTEVLSGGEKQRLAIACALAKDPQLVIADEPTSALDNKNTDHIIRLFKMIAEEGKIVIIATHNKRVQQACDVIYTIEDRKIKSTSTTINSPTKSLQPSKISKTFYSWYSKFHFGESKWKRAIFAFIPAFAISICVFMNILNSTLNTQYKELLNQFASNEIFLEYSLGTISNSALQRLNKIEGVENVHLVNKDYIDNITIDDKTIKTDDIGIVEIAPYFDYQIKYFNLKWEQAGEVYLSYDLANQLDISKAEEIAFNNKKYRIGGVFAYRYTLTQKANSRFVIYVPENYFKSTTSNMALLELESFEYMKDIPDKIRGINSNFKLTLSQDKYLAQIANFENYEKLLSSFSISLTSIIIVLLSISRLFTIHNQKYEISVLKANGLSKKEIIKLMVVMFIEDMIKCIALGTGLLILETMIANLFISVNLFTLATPMGIIGLSTLVYIVPSLLTLVYINHFDVEKLIRF